MPIVEAFALADAVYGASEAVTAAEAATAAAEAAAAAQAAGTTATALTAADLAGASMAPEIATRSLAPGITQAAIEGTQALPATSPLIPPVQNAASQYALNPPQSLGLQASASSLPTNVGSSYGFGSPSIAPGGIMTPPTMPEPSWWSTLSPFEKGMTAYAGATGLARLGAFGYGSTPSTMQPYSGSLSKYSISPNFRPQVANPSQFQYQPRYMAEGGITSVPGYAKGGNLSDAMEYYKMMAGQTENISENRRAPSAGIDTGIYYDTDPDTQRADALTAAQIRMAKVNKRTGMQGQGMTRPQGLGQLSLAPIGSKPGQEAQYQDITAAQGGIMQAGGGPVEQMSNANAIGANTGFPMADIQRGAYATPYQQPISQNVVTGASDTRVDPYTGEERLAGGGIAGISTLGGYAAGGNPRLLKGPGDGMSDNIPAMIGNRQPARLADGEFVVPADVVSHLGNGSTDAGAKKLDHMMTKVRKARTGNPKQGKQINPDKYLPK